MTPKGVRGRNIVLNATFNNISAIFIGVSSDRLGLSFGLIAILPFGIAAVVVVMVW
jgi:hypothetical protein